MLYNGFCGGSNQSQSPIADGERTSNLYLEPIQSPGAPAGNALYPTPGETQFIQTGQITDVGTRAFLSEINGRSFAVIGAHLYELFVTGLAIQRGVVAQDNNPATISYNGKTGNQLFVTSGGNGYSYDLTGNTLTQVAALNGLATQGGMKDGYFLSFSQPNSTVYVSNLNDGTTWNTGVMFFSRTIAPDPWMAMVVGNPEIFLIGEQSAEAWYNAGNTPQPFAPILSSFMQSGTPASFSAGLVNDTLVWLQQTSKGSAKIMAARGYVPRPISNYAVETALSRYLRTSTISDCELLAYQQEGHLFACFNFPMGHNSWCIDMDTGAWHERNEWNAATSSESVWGPRVHGYAFGKNLIGDRSSGVISYLDVTVGSNNGAVIRRTRIGPPLWASAGQRLQVGLLSLIMDVGLGLATGQGSNPQVMMETTQDGRVFGFQRMASAGAMGQYTKRVFWTRCGSSRKLWAPRITTTDPTPWRFIGAEIMGAGFQQAKAA